MKSKKINLENRKYVIASVVVGMLLVLVADNLQREEAQDVDKHDAYHHAGNDIFSVFQIDFLGFHTVMATR